MAYAEDKGDYFRIPPDARDLNYGKYVDEGSSVCASMSNLSEYNSHNTKRLDVEQMIDLLLKLEGIHSISRGETTQFEEC